MAENYLPQEQEKTLEQQMLQIVEETAQRIQSLIMPRIIDLADRGKLDSVPVMLDEKLIRNGYNEHTIPYGRKHGRIRGFTLRDTYIETEPIVIISDAGLFSCTPCSDGPYAPKLPHWPSRKTFSQLWLTFGTQVSRKLKDVQTLADLQDKN